MNYHTESLEPGTHRIEISFPGGYPENFYAYVSVFVNGKYMNKFANTNFKPGETYSFKITLKPNDVVLCCVHIKQCNCTYEYTYTCKSMENKLTIGGVEVELTPEQAKKLKEGLCEASIAKQDTPSKLSWEGLNRVKGYFTSTNGEICDIREGIATKPNNRNIWPTKEYAEASIALAQLLQIRKSLIGDWVPDWTGPTVKYIIQPSYLGAYRSSTQNIMRSLSFPSKEMADKVLTDCKDLLEIAKPLL